MNKEQNLEVYEDSIRALEHQLYAIQKIVNEIYDSIFHFQKLQYGYKTEEWDQDKWHQAMLERRDQMITDIWFDLDIDKDLDHYEVLRYKKMINLCSSKQGIDFVRNLIRRARDD